MRRHRRLGKRLQRFWQVACYYHQRYLVFLPPPLLPCRMSGRSGGGRMYEDCSLPFPFSSSSFFFLLWPRTRSRPCTELPLKWSLWTTRAIYCKMQYNLASGPAEVVTLHNVVTAYHAGSCFSNCHYEYVIPACHATSIDAIAAYHARSCFASCHY